MVMSGGWMMQKKEVELRGFIKVFQIPEGVVLDKIKAKFNDQESNLKIYMPKLVKGIRGVRVEEVKETEMDKGQPEIAGTSSNQVPQTFEEGSEMQRTKTEEEVTGQDVKEGESIRKDIRENKIQSMQEIERKESDDDHGGKVQTIPQKAEGTHQNVKSKVPEITKTEEIHEVADVSPKEHLAKKATPQKVEPPAKTVTFKEASTKETEKVEPQPTIETQRKKFPELEKQKIEKDAPNVPSKQQDQAQERQTTEEIHQVEGGYRKDTKDIEAPKRLQGDRVPERAETSHPAEKEIQEEAEHIEENKTSVPEHAEVEKQKNVSKEQNEDKSDSKKHLVVIAGSAIVVTFIMLLMNKIRTRKR